MAVQEPRDAPGCVATQETPSMVDGMVTESLCDTVASQETPNLVDGTVAESIYDVTAASAVGESTEGNITLSMEIDFSLNSQVIRS